MTATSTFGFCAAAAVGLGLFLLFGVIAHRSAGADLGSDPVPQALVITGIVVAFSATALAVALLLRQFQATGAATLRADSPADAATDSTGA
jgi:multicomponent Na+:H+ antiporter subunit C